MNIMEKLAVRISELKNPTVAGLDTRIEYLPESFCCGDSAGRHPLL